MRLIRHLLGEIEYRNLPDEYGDMLKSCMVEKHKVYMMRLILRDLIKSLSEEAEETRVSSTKEDS